MGAIKNKSVMFDGDGNAIPTSRVAKRAKGQAKALMAGGFKGANDESLNDWVFLPLEINTILRNDLLKLRARSRDLVRNDDTARRYLSLLKQNVLGHKGIKLQAKNRLRNRKPDKKWNDEIEREWKSYGSKRRYRGQCMSPSICGQQSLLELSWLALLSRATDGECFIQILRGYPHNKHRLGLRMLNPDLLDSTYCTEAENGNRIEMGIEFDEFGRPVAYHFSQEHPLIKTRDRNQPRERIPADQILHIFRRDHVGQLRGIPDFASIMHKQKMLNGVHEAVVVGWRVAAAKMGFFVTKDDELLDPADDPDGTDERQAPMDAFDASPGSFDYISDSVDFKQFDVKYPDSTYTEGYKTFMRQLSNGLNVSSPTLSNDYSDVNYSSLRQALLEDRDGWRCIQTEMVEGFYQPLFDEWYDWTTTITGLINVADSKRNLEPVVEWQPRGWTWVDPLKEGRAQIEAVKANLRTRQSVIAETSGEDFTEVAASLEEEQALLEELGLAINADEPPATSNQTPPPEDQTDDEDTDDETEDEGDDDE